MNVNYYRNEISEVRNTIAASVSVCNTAIMSLTKFTQTVDHNCRGDRQILENTLRKEIELLDERMIDLDSKGKERIQKRYEHLYIKIKALESSEVQSKPRSNSTPAQIQTPVKPSKLVPIGEETSPAATPLKKTPLKASNSLPITKDIVTSAKETSQRKIEKTNQLTPFAKMLVNKNVKGLKGESLEYEELENLKGFAGQNGISFGSFKKTTPQKTSLKFGFFTPKK